MARLRRCSWRRRLEWCEKRLRTWAYAQSQRWRNVVQRIVNRQVVHGGNDFALGEVSRGAEENYRAGSTTPRTPTGTNGIRSHRLFLRQVAPCQVCDAASAQNYTSTHSFQARTQLIRVLMVNGVHRQSPRGFQIERAVINERHAPGALCDFQRHAKDHLFRLAGSNVAGTEENEKVPSKVESFNAVLVELQRSLLMAPTKYFPELETLSRMARVSGYSSDCANMKAVNSSRVSCAGDRTRSGRDIHSR